MDDYLAVFSRAADRCASEIERSKLEVTVGTWLESSVLKLQKRHWRSDGKTPNAARSEIFFAVWTNAKGVKLDRAFYNIHALRLRGLRGHKLESWKFAGAFRAEFSARQKDWPNVSVDYGPGNLMEGWIVLGQDGLEESIAELIKRFLPLADVIDTLLEKRKKPNPER